MVKNMFKRSLQADLQIQRACCEAFERRGDSTVNCGRFVNCCVFLCAFQLKMQLITHVMNLYFLRMITYRVLRHDGKTIDYCNEKHTF